MKSVMLVLVLLGGCALDTTPTVEAEEQELVIGCSQNTLKRAALDNILDIFWGYREECRSISLGRGVYGYECGLPEAYIYDRELGYDRAIDRFYTRVIPIGPTKSTRAQLQYDQCGDGRAGDPGQGARTPLDSSCGTAGWVTCACVSPYSSTITCSTKTVWD